jgi:PAS domain S-box-containing protein
VIRSNDDADEVRAGSAEAHKALEEWRRLADANFPTERRTIVRIEAEHAALTATGEQLIASVDRGHHAEATVLLAHTIRPRLDLILRMSEEARLQRTRDMSRSVARITGGINYLGFLKLGRLQKRIDDLDTHVTKVLESAGLRNTLEAQVAKYWGFYIHQDPAIRQDLAVLHDRVETGFQGWRSAILTSRGKEGFGGPTQAAELAFLEDMHHEYQTLETRANRVFSLLASGSSAEAKAILVDEMEFENMRTAQGLETYIDRETEVARENLASLRQQTARVRTLLALAGTALLIVGFGVPWFFSRSMIGPIVNLQVAAERIGQGDFDARVPVPSVRELGTLATTFNSMTSELQTSRESLRRSRERFALVARATSDVIWDLDMKTRTAHVSGSFANKYGFDETAPITEADWMDRVHPEDRDRIQREFGRSMQDTGNLHIKEYRYRREDGSYDYVTDHAYIVRGENHAPLRVIGAMSNVTERKTAEQAIAALSRQNEMILDSVGDGILGIDRNGDIISANPAAAAMLGWSSDELVGKPLRDLIRPNSRNEAGFRWEDSPVPATLERGTRETSDSHRFARADGLMFPADFTSNPMYDEACRIIGAVVAFRDITQKYEVDRLKSQFVSTVSHELRTPLTSIRGSLGLLSSGLLGTVSPKGQRMLEIAVSNTDRLVRLINDILDIERLNSGALTLSKQPIDATDLMREAVEVMKPMADQAGVAMIWSPFRGTISADQDRMMQTLTNLLSNAIKFSPEASTITMSAERVGSMLCFRIADQGRGIPADKLESVFERFQQVDASDSRDKGGTGLGLPICRSIVQQHGGKLWVESVLGQGSTFFFTVPLAEESLRASDEQLILICGDDASIRDSLEARLRGRGYEVISAACGDQTVALARKHLPSAILLDLLTPGVNAWETIAALKEDVATRAIPILVASLLPAPTERVEGVHAGQIAGWIPRPFDTDRLFETLDRVTGRSSLAPRILLVEDDLDLASVLQAVFEKAGVTVMHAGNGVEAIEMATRNPPDLLVLDVVLPRLNGFSVVKRMKENPLLRNIPVVIYSGSEIAPADRQRLQLGPTAFFTKSRISPEMFEQAVLGLLHEMMEEKTDSDHAQARIAH